MIEHESFMYETDISGDKVLTGIPMKVNKKDGLYYIEVGSRTLAACSNDIDATIIFRLIEMHGADLIKEQLGELDNFIF